MTVEEARRQYQWNAFRLKVEAKWIAQRVPNQADISWWHSIALDVDASSIDLDNAIAEAVHGDERELVAW